MPAESEWGAEMGTSQFCFDSLPLMPGESVWTYPAVSRVEPCHRALRVMHSGRTIAHTTHGLRVVQTGHPPLYFFPMEDVRTDYLVLARGEASCAHRGPARAFDVRVEGRRAPRAAWIHGQPEPSHSALKGHIAFHAGRLDGAFVDGERVIPQPGGELGGWITRDLVGPFIGAG